jgi:acyl-CoA thioester hydrolase
MSVFPADRPTRDAFPRREPMTLRWHDNDVYGHMNNVVYYSLFDTAVNRWLIEAARLAVPGGDVIGLVAETGCRYYASVGYPDPVEIGVGVTRVGRTSLTYRLALFGSAAEAAAICHYVHVYVDRESQRPVPLPDHLRHAAEAIAIT